MVTCVSDQLPIDQRFQPPPPWLRIICESSSQNSRETCSFPDHWCPTGEGSSAAGRQRSRRTPGPPRPLLVLRSSQTPMRSPTRELAKPGPRHRGSPGGSKTEARLTASLATGDWFNLQGHRRNSLPSLEAGVELTAGVPPITAFVQRLSKGDLIYITSHSIPITEEIPRVLGAL